MEKSQELIKVEKEILKEWLSCCGKHIAEKNKWDHPAIQKAYEELVKMSNDPVSVEKTIKREIELVEKYIIYDDFSIKDLKGHFSLDSEDLQRIYDAIKKKQ